MEQPWFIRYLTNYDSYAKRGGLSAPSSFHMKQLLLRLPARAVAALFELAAGCIDIAPSRIANRCLNTVHGKTALEGLDLLDRRRAERAVGDVVELDEVDVAERSLAEVDKRLHFRIGIVDTVDHREFVRRPTPGLLGVLLQRLMEPQQRVFLNTWHELVTRRLHSGVQRDGEGELFGQLSEALDARNDARGRYSEMARADFESSRGVQHAKRLHGGFVVGKRLALAHEHHARHALAEVVRNMKDLVDHLARRERAREARKARRAEGASHAASGLRGDAHGKLVASRHADGFNGGSIAKLQQILARSVARYLTSDLDGHAERETLSELCAKRFGEVGHVVEGLCVLFEQPFAQLLGAKGRLAELGGELGQVIFGEGADVAPLFCTFHLVPSERVMQDRYLYNKVSMLITAAESRGTMVRHGAYTPLTEMGRDVMSCIDRGSLHIAVLAGGTSDEREISLNSGANVVAALRDAGFGSVELLDTGSDSFFSQLLSGSFDAAFIALHGEGGEDGTIQGALEFVGIPYTGSGVASSACAADKDISKVLYERAGIPVALGIAIERSEAYDVEEIVSQLGESCFVKPAVNGSSYGITYVKRVDQLADAIEHAFDFSDKVLVEKRVEGTEITVGVYGGETLRALPIVEIIAQEGSDFFDLSVKYLSPDKIHHIPARIPEEQYRRAQELACKAHEALGCFGLSRSDFIVTEEGPVILETNTIPGMTDTSLFPDEIRHTELVFPEVCAELVEMAIERAAR